MDNFVLSKINELPSGYVAALKRVVSRRSFGDSPTIEELASDVARKITNGDFNYIFEHTKFNPNTVIRSDDITKMLLQAYVDSSGLYKQANAIGSFLPEFNVLSQSNDVDIAKSLLRANEIVLGLLANRRNPDYNLVRYISFEQALNKYEGVNPAYIDDKTGLLGPRVESVEKHAQERGPDKPKISVSLVGSGISDNVHKTFDPYKAVDLDDLSFWLDVIISDKIVTSKLDNTEHLGAIVKFTIEYAHPVRVNQIRLSPSCRYPMSLLQATYTHSGIVRTIPGLSSEYLLDEDVSEFLFEPIDATSISLYLKQSAFDDLQVFIPESMYRSAEMFDLIADSAFNLVDGSEPTSFNRVNEALIRSSKAQSLINHNDLKASTEKIILTMTRDSSILSRAQRLVGNEVSPPPVEKVFELNKYFYNFGIRNLETNYVTYARSSTYSSGVLSVSGTPIILAVEPSSVDCASDDGVVGFSGVEYDIEISGDKTIPVLPENSTDVYGEYIVFNKENRKAPLRFRAASITNVYLNGTVLPSGSYRLTDSGRSVYFKTSVVDPLEIYHINIDYELYETFTGVDITDTYDGSRTVSGVYNSTKNKTIVLNSPPYILPEIVFNNVNWTKSQDNTYIYSAAYDEYDGSDETDSPVIKLDNDYYGSYIAYLTNPMTEEANFFYSDRAIPILGKVVINGELMEYERKDYFAPGNTDDDRYKVAIVSSRGLEGTAVAYSGTGSLITWVSNSSYDPITVVINGVKAKNLTDYTTGKHAAFQQSDIPTFVQVGNVLYFDKDYRGVITVSSKKLVDYVKLNIRFNCFDPISRDKTDKISNVVLKMKASIT